MAMSRLVPLLEFNQNDGFFVGQLGEFLHAVAFGEKGRAELLERLANWPTK